MPGSSPPPPNQAFPSSPEDGALQQLRLAGEGQGRALTAAREEQQAGHERHEKALAQAWRPVLAVTCMGGWPPGHGVRPLARTFLCSRGGGRETGVRVGCSGHCTTVNFGDFGV